MSTAKDEVQKICPDAICKREHVYMQGYVYYVTLKIGQKPFIGGPSPALAWKNALRRLRKMFK